MTPPADAAAAAATAMRTRISNFYFIKFSYNILCARVRPSTQSNAFLRYTQADAISINNAYKHKFNLIIIAYYVNERTRVTFFVRGWASRRRRRRQVPACHKSDEKNYRF